ncbi:MAG TPA: hypothetical protein PK539_00660 [Candidatus Paceibacterota bacterium]|nr:hypothetical protein [Candidatus Paceibacterota bacterium]
MKTSLVMVLAACMWASPTFAAPSGNAAASSSSNSSAAAIGAVGAPVANANGGAANAQGGNAAAQGGSAKSAINASQKVSGINGSVQTSTTFNQTFGGSKVPVQVPTVFPAAIPTPQIFGNLGTPPVVKGIKFMEQFVTSCDMTVTRENPLTPKHFSSGGVDITFYPTQEYYWAPQYPHDYYRGEKIPWNAKPVKVDHVSIIMPAQAIGKKYLCLGALPAQAKRGSINPLSLPGEVQRAVRYHLWGHKEMDVMLVPNTIAAARGVRMTGGSFSILPGLALASSSMLTNGALGVNFSGGHGSTYASAKLGMTFLLVAPSPYGSVLVKNVTK